MEYFITADPIEKSACACLILGTFEDGELAPSAKKIDQSTHGLLGRLLKRDEFKAKPGDTLLLNHVPDSPIERILLTGLGKKKQLNSKAYRKALAAAIKSLKQTRAKDAVCALTEVDVGERDLEWKARQIVEVFEDGLYTFTQ
ncbi:MAG: M17 family peptidase N-terminal domain-containing protein, partial [Pseudomonadota bacterium]